MAVKDNAKPVTPVLFVRGDAARRGEPVERRFLQILAPAKTPFSSETNASRPYTEIQIGSV